MILFRMAWRYILSYFRRTVVTVVLIASMTALLIFTSSFMSGSHQTMIRSGVEIYPGYIQITTRQFRKSPGLENLIFDVTMIKELLKGVTEIHTLAARYESYVLYASEEKGVAGLFTGIEPEEESHLSRLESSLVKGRFLRSSDYGKVYMGTELAKKLKVEVGDTLSFIGTASDYSFAADNLQVVGLFRTGLFEFDANAAFTPKSYIDDIMAAHNLASQLVILPRDPPNSAALSQHINTILQDSQYVAEDWSSRLSGLVQAMKVDSIFGYLTLGVIFLVILFVIMIYTFLSIFARVRLVGVLRAIGTTPAQIAATFLMESAILSTCGVLLGAVMGGAVAYYFNIHPIDYSGYEEQFKQYGLAASEMPALFSPMLIVRDGTIMLVLSILSTLYPIIKVTGFRPVEAMHHV